MSTKTAKLKTISNGSPAAKRSKSANGKARSPAKKKPINELWIEKYGIDDSKAAKALRRAWQKSYESHQKNKTP